MHPLAQSFFNYIEFEKRYSKHTLEAYKTDLEQLSDFLVKNESNDITRASHHDIRNWIVSMMEQKNPTSFIIHDKCAIELNLDEALAKLPDLE